MKRVLIARGGALGDLILTLPVVRALRMQVPDLHLEVLANSAYTTLLTHCARVAASRALDSASLAPFFAEGARLPADWRNWFDQFDTIISYLHDADRVFEKNVTRLTGAEFISGPSRLNETTHAARQLAQPLESLGIDVSNFAPELCCEASSSIRHRTFALHPGSGSARKNWPIDRWIALGEQLLARGSSLLVITGEADRAQNEVLSVRWREAKVEFADQRPLDELAQLLGETKFIGHDSGISHLAAAAGADCLLLFGPTNPEVWAPLNSQVRVIRALNNDLAQLEPDVVTNALAC